MDEGRWKDGGWMVQEREGSRNSVGCDLTCEKKIKLELVVDRVSGFFHHIPFTIPLAFFLFFLFPYVSFPFFL